MIILTLQITQKVTLQGGRVLMSGITPDQRRGWRFPIQGRAQLQIHAILSSRKGSRDFIPVSHPNRNDRFFYRGWFSRPPLPNKKIQPPLPNPRPLWHNTCTHW